MPKLLTRRHLLCSALALSAAPPLSAASNNAPTYDVLIYGSTPGGIAAAIEASRRGLKTALVCPNFHPGGMTASGLCTTDAVRPQLFGGLVAEFISRVRQIYLRVLGENHPDWKLIKDGWYYEPRIAQQVFEDLLAEHQGQLEWLPGWHLDKVETRQSHILSATFTSDKTPGQTQTLAATTFIDGTYEGDLAAMAGVPYRVGRESKEEHGESRAGIHYMDWKKGTQIPTPDTGEASPAIQAFCARSIFTTDPAKTVPLEKPDSYEQHLPDLLPLLPDFASGRVKKISLGTPLPNQKFQLNGSIEDLTSINCPGVSWTWPEAARHHRARLQRFHIDHAASYAWFLQNDPHVPDDIRALWKTAGLHRDEFTSNQHWPWQIYVRQGRRIEGRARVTQHNFTINPKTGTTPSVEHPIAIGEHSFDIHPCHDRRYAVEGFMEGVLWHPKKALGPAQPGQVPYEAIVPTKIDNLLVPVALSCTHIAMSVLRMEPVWMTLGQIAGLAAFDAREQKRTVSSIDPASLPQRLGIQVKV